MEDIDEQFQQKQGVAEEDDFSEDGEDNVEDLRKASKLLKDNAVLLEFLSNPEFCKNVNNSYRKLMGKQLDKIYQLTDELDELIELFED